VLQINNVLELQNMLPSSGKVENDHNTVERVDCEALPVPASSCFEYWFELASLGLTDCNRIQSALQTGS
jgi:hypothetical protein